MNKKITFLLLLLSCLYMQMYSQVVNHWTTVGSSAQWQAYQLASTPPNWPNVCNQTANWGNPMAGLPNGGQFAWTAGLFPAGSIPNDPNNFVWAVSTAMNVVPQTVFFRHIFTRSANTCKRERILCVSDEARIIRVNGQIVATAPFGGNNPAPWGFLTNVDITPFLVCGENCVTIEVTNTSSFRHLVANRQTTNTDITFTGQAGFNVGLQCDEDLRLTGPNMPGATYSWSGPNQFSSSLQNPIIPHATSKHKRLYTCTMTLGCCTKSSSVLVDFEDCDKCEAELNIQEIPCDGFDITLSSRFVDITCSIIQVDGVTSYLTSPFYPSPGVHVICAHYLGTLKSDPNVICCNEVCDTIVVEGIKHEFETYNYCEMLPYSAGVEFDPCFNSTYPYFSYASSPFPMMSTCAQSMIMLLTQGTHVFEYYDENGCLRLVKTIEVTKTLPLMRQCQGRHIIPCDQIGYNIDDLVPANETCSCGINPGDVVHKSVINNYWTYPAMEEVVVVRYYNITQCVICDYTYTIVEQKCDFVPHFAILTSTQGPLSYNFVKISPTANVCGVETWEIQDGFGNTIVSFINPVNGDPIPYTFPQPGEYYVCMTSCICVCDQPCCKTRCYHLTVNHNPPFLIIHDQGDDTTQEIEGNLKMATEESDKTTNTLKIKPNPTSDVFQIQSTNAEKATFDLVELYGQNGQLVKLYKNIESTNQYDVSALPRGLYVIRVHEGDKFQSLRLVLQ